MYLLTSNNNELISIQIIMFLYWYLFFVVSVNFVGGLFFSKGLWDTNISFPFVKVGQE